METIPRRSFTKQRKQFLQANDKLYEDMELPTKNIRSSLSTEIINQAHRIMMEDEKDVLAGQYRKSPAFEFYHIFAPVSLIEKILGRRNF